MARAKSNKRAAKPTAAAKAATPKAPAKRRVTKADTAAASISFKVLQQATSVTVPTAHADLVEALCAEAKLAVNRVDSDDTVRFVREIKSRDGRMARSATITKFQLAIDSAIAQGRKSKDGTVEVNCADLTAGGLGHTWLKTQHGWKDNMTCGRAAIACGFPNYQLRNPSKDTRRVVLAPEGVELPK
jgi:hypothetical protein